MKKDGRDANSGAALDHCDSAVPRSEFRVPSFPWLPALLQTADSLYPTGAYAHSGGLETLVQLGVVTDAASLLEFLRGRVVPMLAHYDLPYLGFALAAAEDVRELCALDREYGAGKLAREAREASAQMGAQRLRMLLRGGQAAALSEVGAGNAEAFQAAVARGEADGHAVIVGGLQAHQQGAPVAAAMTAYFYGSVSGYSSAALKLIRIGQEGCQGVLGECLTLAEATVERALTVAREDAGWCDPAWEIAAVRHERAFARLFIS